jgi:Lon-like protease
MRRMLRPALYSASLAIVVAAAFVVPLPWVEYLPGRPTTIDDLFELGGVETTELVGETAMLTVYLRQQPPAMALRALLDDDRDLLPASRVYPDGIDRSEYLELQRERFGRQFEIAMAVGAQAAGYEPELLTEVVVVEVVQGSAADGALLPGDVVRAVDGDPVVAAEELQAFARAGQVGDPLLLTVERDGSEHDVRVELGTLPGTDEPRIGIAIRTAVDVLRFPFEVEIEDTRIGGPSAGLMIGLTVYDLLAEEDLLAGRRVAGTGSLDADGSVGTVGGVREKMAAAVEFGADIVLVPGAQLDDALAGAPEGLTVVGVDTLDDAIAVLRERR